jgi:phospholipase C
MIRFIEDNWQIGRIGDSSIGAPAGGIGGMFDFNKVRPAPALILDPNTGEVVEPDE